MRLTTTNIIRLCATITVYCQEIDADVQVKVTFKTNGRELLEVLETKIVSDFVHGDAVGWMMDNEEDIFYILQDRLAAGSLKLA